jgi:hypothetical protein
MRWNGNHSHFTVGDVTTKSDGDQLHSTKGSHSTVANSDIIHTTQKNFTTTAQSNVSMSAQSAWSHSGKTITASATGGDHTLKASGGDVITSGTSTKIQNGGVHAPPTTFS